jgi:hypothetical protein
MLPGLEGPNVASNIGAWDKLPYLVFRIIARDRFEPINAIAQVQSLGGPKNLGPLLRQSYVYTYLFLHRVIHRCQQAMLRNPTPIPVQRQLTLEAD